MGMKPAKFTQSEVLGVVYFMHIGDRRSVKIGYTTNLEARVKSFQTGNLIVEVILSVSGPRSLETKIHRALSHARRAREIFNYQDHRVYFFIEYAKYKGLDFAFEFLTGTTPEAVRKRDEERRRAVAWALRQKRERMDSACADLVEQRKQARGW